MNHKIIWNLGFRGQGDTPFWENDPQYDTPEKRGQLISSIMQEQYDLVKNTLRILFLAQICMEKPWSFISRG